MKLEFTSKFVDQKLHVVFGSVCLQESHFPRAQVELVIKCGEISVAIFLLLKIFHGFLYFHVFLKSLYLQIKFSYLSFSYHEYQIMVKYIVTPLHKIGYNGILFKIQWGYLKSC